MGALGSRSEAETGEAHPALGQEFEACGLAAAAHDVQIPPAKGTQGFDPCDQFTSTIMHEFQNTLSEKAVSLFAADTALDEP